MTPAQEATDLMLQRLRQTIISTTVAAAQKNALRDIINMIDDAYDPAEIRALAQRALDLDQELTSTADAREMRARTDRERS